MPVKTKEAVEAIELAAVGEFAVKTQRQSSWKPMWVCKMQRAVDLFSKNNIAQQTIITFHRS